MIYGGEHGKRRVFNELFNVAGFQNAVDVNVLQPLADFLNQLLSQIPLIYISATSVFVSCPISIFQPIHQAFLHTCGSWKYWFAEIQ